MNSNNIDIQDLITVNFGEESILETTKYLVALQMERSHLIFAVYDKDMNEVFDNETYQDFINDYGDVTFTFKDVSNVTIPGE